MAQKIVTVNINVYEQSTTDRHSAYDIRYVNKYLDEGWVVKQTLHSPAVASNWINLTFILEK